MYTHCPHCDTYFRVTSEQLKRARGDVRCGRCFGTFNALQHLVDTPPDQAPATAAQEPSQKPDEAPAVAATATADAPPDDTPMADAETSATEPPATAAGDNLKHDRSQQLIEELQTTPVEHGGGGRRLWWGLLSLPLALLLAGQYVYFNLNQLSQKPELRPALVEMCLVAGCDVPLIRAPQRIKLTERDIRSHPDTKDILLVKATMVNEAEFTQAFPVMELVLHDITGHPIAGRRFLPEEYLVDPSLSLARGFASNSSVTVVLELVDPGAEAVGFEFNFL